MTDVQAWPGIAAVPAAWDALLAPGPALQGSRTWFAATEDAALPPGAQPVYAGVSLDGSPAMLLPLLAGVGSLSTPYTLCWRPLLAPGLDGPGLHQAARAFGRWCRQWPVLVLDALPGDWPALGAWRRGVRAGGMAVRQFQQFGNWHEPVAGRTWDEYLAARPGRSRETLRRKGRLAARDGLRFEAVSDPAAIGPALDAYEAIYARSWKVPEPFPRFNAALLHRAAALGAARLGVAWLGGVVVAAQYWTVSDGVATVMKLAHDGAHKALSPGTLLTAHMVRLLLAERVATLDFGRGDDPYKQSWATQRRQHVGLLLANPRRPRGLLALLRQDAGRARRLLRGTAWPG